MTGRLQDQAADAELARGLGLHRAGRLGEAEAAYRAALVRSADHPHALNYLGVVLAATGHAEAALDLLRRSVKRLPSVPEFHLNLADALMSLGRLDGAETALRKALQLKRSAAALTKMGLLLYRQGKLRPAAHQFDQALALDPAHLDARQNLGAVAAQLGESERASRLLRGVLALAPAHVAGLNALAALAQIVGQPRSAARSLWRIISLDPAFGPAHANLVTTLGLLGLRDAAARHARKALALSPQDAIAWSNFGNLSHEMQRRADSERQLRRSLWLNPGNPSAWSNLGRALNARGRFAEAVAAYRHALRLDPLHAGAGSNLLFLTQYDPSFSPAAILAEHAAYGQVHEAAAVASRTQHPNPRDPARRLRVGYVSPDFARHPVGLFLSPVMTQHDPAEVEIVCYSDRVQEDHVTDLLRASAHAFHRTSGLNDAALDRRIRDDAIDILVDLAGHTAGNRLPVFARKPAPVQVSWLGYFATTGLKTIDAVLADPWEVEPDDERWYTEKIIRLPSGRLCYPPPTDAPDIPPLPALGGAPFTFASFNNATKLNDTVIETWSELLRRMPESRLMLRAAALADPEHQAATAARFRRHAIDRNRLDMGSLAPTEVLAGYREADLALDPFPFTGALTTCEALWMGLPVITLKGERPVSRQSASFLHRLGLPDLIAESQEAYVELALALASDLSKLAKLRHGMRARMLRSSVTDGPAAARNLEMVFRMLWQRWCGAPS